MRWRVIDPTNRSDAAQRRAVTLRIESWWREFQSKTDEIAALFSQKANWDLPDWMAHHLDAIHPNLMWEYGPAMRDIGHRLVITPESAHHFRPLVRTILSRAPALDGWEFYEYRLAEDLESTLLTVEGRTGRNIADFQFRASLGENQRINLNFASPTIVDREDPSALNAAFIATETLLGEQILNDWIGAIEITSMPRTKGLKARFGRGGRELPLFLGLDRLKETVGALIVSIREQLPPNLQCEWVEGASWSLWELKSEQADDYYEQQDLFVGTSANPTQWVAAHSEGLFSSEQFSRFGETFCYVKLDGSHGLGEEGFADRSEIEDALDAVLKPDKLGCHLGGGTGLRYSYIDLALTDMDQGILATRQRLQAGRVPKRSWIQFWDSDLAAEWVGVYHDSPPPPLAFDS